MSNVTTPITARRWQPTRFMKAALAAHVCLLLWLVLAPQYWAWAVTLFVVLHLVIIAAGMWPRSSLLGSNWTHIPSAAGDVIAITIDDGPHPEVTPKVLDLLDAAHAKATFFCIGKEVERFPELSREIIRRGHSIENHSYHHHHAFAFKAISGFTLELQQAQNAITQCTGQTPLFFRAPAGMRNPFLDIVLQRLGLQYASWTRRGYDTQRNDIAALEKKLLSNLSAGDILLLHDGNAAQSHSGQAMILEVLPTLLQATRLAGLKCVTLRSCLPSTPFSF